MSADLLREPGVLSSLRKDGAHRRGVISGDTSMAVMIRQGQAAPRGCFRPHLFSYIRSNLDTMCKVQPTVTVNYYDTAMTATKVTSET